MKHKKQRIETYGNRMCCICIALYWIKTQSSNPGILIGLNEPGVLVHWNENEALAPEIKE